MPIAKVVLLVVGSFNPPTIMHLRMFEIARDHLDRTGQYKVIGGIASPVHDKYGKKDLAPASHRCGMVRLALQTSGWIHLSDWECKQEGWTPTRQVLQYHQNLLNAALNSNKAPVKQQCYDGLDWVSSALKHCENDDVSITVKMLCGADVIETFAIPGVWLEEDIVAIVSDHGIVVVTREGCNPAKFIYETDILTKHQRNITIVNEWIANEISSTKIRRAIRRGESVKYLLLDPVISYINNNALYMTYDKR